jgi:hypothetical protein
MRQRGVMFLLFAPDYSWWWEKWRTGCRIEERRRRPDDDVFPTTP